MAILLELAIVTSLICVARTSPSNSTGKEWDYFLFVQEHPPGACEPANEGEGGPCSFPKNASSFIMHGIWPTTSKSTGPNFCNNSAKFYPSEIQELVPTLVTGWTNIWLNSGFYDFWSHEWRKHGTCATGIKEMSTEYGYFATTLSLLAKYNITTVLEKHDIKPSNGTTYTVAEFTQAFQSAYGVKPLLECTTSRVGQVLQQITICLQKNFKIMPCDESVFDILTVCDPNEDVNFIASWY